MSESRVLILLAAAAVILWRNLPAGLLCLWPGWMRIRKLDETSRGVDPALMSTAEEELSPLGFKPVGVHEERPPLGRGVPCYDFVNEAEQSFASLWRERGEVLFLLLTPFEQGGFVLTAGHKRQGVERKGYLSGGIPDAPPEQLLPVHRRRIERLKQEGLAPTADYSLDGRVKAADAWFRHAGVRELRLKNANRLILSVMGVVILISVLQSALRAKPSVPHTAAGEPNQEAVK